MNAGGMNAGGMNAGGANAAGTAGGGMSAGGTSAAPCVTGSCDPASCASGACFDAERCATSTQVDYGGPTFENGMDVVVTPAGDRVIAGFFALDGENDSDRDIFVAKVSASGAELWRREVATSGRDYINAIVRDASGNLYVAGASEGDIQGQPNQGERDALVLKLADDGTLVWALSFGGTGSDTANDLALDAAGTVIAVGQLGYDYDASTRGAFVAVVSPDGQLVSNDEFVMPGQFPELSAVAVDAAGNVVLAGEVLPTFSGPGDLFVRKLGPDGAELWTRQWTGVEDDWPNDVVVNASGEIFVSGTTSGILEGNPDPEDGWSLFLSKVTAAGEIAFTRTYYPDTDTRGGALVLAGNGDLVMVGTIVGRLSLEEEALGADPFLVRVCPSGEPRSTMRWSLPGDDWSWGAAATSDGALVFSGYAYREAGKGTQASLTTVTAE
jgi:hypothetical protein